MSNMSYTKSAAPTCCAQQAAVEKWQNSKQQRKNKSIDLPFEHLKTAIRDFKNPSDASESISAVEETSNHASDNVSAVEETPNHASDSISAAEETLNHASDSVSAAEASFSDTSDKKNTCVNILSDASGKRNTHVNISNDTSDKKNTRVNILSDVWEKQEKRGGTIVTSPSPFPLFLFAISSSLFTLFSFIFVPNDGCTIVANNSAKGNQHKKQVLQVNPIFTLI